MMRMSETMVLLGRIERAPRLEGAKLLAAWNLGRANMQEDVAEALGLEAEVILLDQKARGIAADLVEGHAKA